MNTGIGDAINLAWKLKEVLAGHAPDALLDSYEQEASRSRAGWLPLRLSWPQEHPAVRYAALALDRFEDFWR